MGFKHVDPVLRGEIKVVVPAKSKINRERVVLVLAYLANRADKSGVAWPSVATISDELGMPRSAVQTALKVLEGQDIISAVGGRSVGGSGKTTHWQLPNRPTGQADNSPTGRADSDESNRPTGSENRPAGAKKPPDTSGTKQKEAVIEAEGGRVELDPGQPVDRTTLELLGHLRSTQGAEDEAVAVEQALRHRWRRSVVDRAIARLSNRGVRGYARTWEDRLSNECHYVAREDQQAEAQAVAACDLCDDHGDIVTTDDMNLTWVHKCDHNVINQEATSATT